MSAIYYFRAKDHNQRIVTGRVKASSKEELEQKLMSKQLLLISASTQKKSKNNVSIFGVKSKHLVIATRQLAFLANASVPLVQAVRTVSNNTPDMSLKKIMEEVAVNIESGNSFSKSLKKYPMVFDDVYISMASAGETGGSLDVMLNRLAVYIEKTDSVKSRIRAGMMYPGFVSFVAFLIVVGLLVFLVPKFEEIFADAGQELPALTRAVVNLSHFLREQFMLFGVLITCLVVSTVIFLRTRNGKMTLEVLASYTPILGDLLTKYRVARFSRTFASMLESGSNVSESLKLGAKSTGGFYFKEAIARAVKMVEAGYSVAKSIAKEKVFPGLVKNMISVGEQTGNMTEVLNKMADFYEEQVDVSVENLLKVIEPLLLVGVAFIIGFIVIAMYLPIFKMGQVLGV